MYNDLECKYWYERYSERLCERWFWCIFRLCLIDFLEKTVDTNRIECNRQNIGYILNWEHQKCTLWEKIGDIFCVWSYPHWLHDHFIDEKDEVGEEEKRNKTIFSIHLASFAQVLGKYEHSYIEHTNKNIDHAYVRVGVPRTHTGRISKEWKCEIFIQSDRNDREEDIFVDVCFEK